MNQVRKTLFLALIAAFPISLGVIKIYLHLLSHFRLGFLDYIIGLGLILGGLFLFLPSRLTVLLASSVLIVFELLKALVDYHDHFDVFISLVAIVYLSIPLLRLVNAHLWTLGETRALGLE